MENSVTLTLEAHYIGQKQPLLPSRQIEMPTTSMTLKRLISHLVQIEVAAFQKRQGEQQLFRMLTAQQIESGKAAGRIDPAAKKVQQPVDVEAAVKIALQAFDDGLFYVFIDGQQIDTLDEPVQINTNSTLKFIRLVALAGG